MGRKPKAVNQKKVQVEVPKQNKSLKKILVAVVLGLVIASGVGLAVKKIESKVQKEKINNYICEVVDFDTEVGILAMRCMVKESE